MIGGDGEQLTADPSGGVASGSAAVAIPRRTVEGLLVLPQQTLTQRGQRLLAVADPTTPGRLHPLRPPQRVSPDSLFGAMAAAGAVTGAALLLLARRIPRRPDYGSTSAASSSTGRKTVS